jgi:hypothetical protein
MWVAGGEPGDTGMEMGTLVVGFGENEGCIDV